MRDEMRDKRCKRGKERDRERERESLYRKKIEEMFSLGLVGGNQL